MAVLKTVSGKVFLAASPTQPSYGWRNRVLGMISMIVVHVAEGASRRRTAEVTVKAGCTLYQLRPRSCAGALGHRTHLMCVLINDTLQSNILQGPVTVVIRNRLSVKDSKGQG